MEGIIEDMWTPYKLLYNTIDKCVKDSVGSRYVELDLCLKKYKQNFFTLMRNPPKNDFYRCQLKDGMTKGVSLSGHSCPILLSKDLVDESIIISDMFDLDEYLSLELLCTAQRQSSYHPGLQRGLIAILLYYDGKKALACSLRDLFQATSGISWTTDIPKEVTLLISAFSQNLVDECNILDRIIEILETMDETKEKELLTKNRALGSKKHQMQVLELFNEIRLALATALFNWSAQRGLSKNVVTRLIQYFSLYKTTESSGNMDDVTMTMLMAFLYSCDTSFLLRIESNAEIVTNMPVLNEVGFAERVYDVLMSDLNWGTNVRLQNFLKFSFGLTLASLRQIPENLQNSISRVIEHDEHLIDECLAFKIFDFIYHNILENDIIFKSEFFFRRIHLIFTDFIDFMHSKITELRGRADETARTVMNYINEGLEAPSNLDNNFDMLMCCIGKFYKNNRSGLSLCIDYWGPLDISSTNSKTYARSVSLFKFVRLAGELLPPSLFVSYLKMIAGLSCCERSARNAFNLLKQVPGLSGSATLSWEHFFSSLTQYYANLRQEQCPRSDTIYKNRILNRTINPQEIEGLCAVLDVIQSVATYDEIAREAICDHPNWEPLHILLGLLGCSVPIKLKSEILKTLAALAKTKETAIQLWNNLEATQIISTIPSPSSYNMCSIETEIEQNECRCETYPLTQSILELLYTLFTTEIPKNIGSGTRKPGLEPYLLFIIDGILLKFYNRTYRNSSEKWLVGAKCLRIVQYLLQTYEINSLDFYENLGHTQAPGFQIMLQLHIKSDLLKLLLLIIYEAVKNLDEYGKFFGKEKLEDCSLYCLNIIEIGLSKQDDFFKAHSVSNSRIMLSGLNKILLDINPRSRKPDHLLNTTKFIMYNSWLPNHSLVSINILNFASRLPHISWQILDTFTQNEQIQTEIRYGFVECLGIKENISNKYENGTDDDSFENYIDLQVKDATITLIQNCLNQPFPNIAHFLLGFDVTKDRHLNQMSKFSGITSSSNCTKSLVALLDNYLETIKSTPTYNNKSERMIEKGYCLLYSLCSHRRTSDTILRYLRKCNDFLYRHISALPFTNFCKSHVLSQMSYLLKCIAIELKLTAHNSQISRFQHLCELLVGFSSKPVNDGVPVELNHYFGNKLCSKSQPVEAESQILLGHIINCLEFDVKNETLPKWEFFDSSLMQKIFQDCESQSNDRTKLINIKKLHNILNDELHAVQTSIVSGQRQLILKEIESVLLFALKVNDEKYRSFSTIKLMEAWGQVTEMLFTAAPSLAFPPASRQELILEILQKVLSKVVSVQTMFELAYISSGTVLLLLVNLKYCYFQKPLKTMNVAGLDFKDVENSIKLDSGNLSPNITSAKSIALSLKFILRNILEWIIISEVSSQKLRINLYAALLNCMCIIKGNNLICEDEKRDELFVSRLDNSIGNVVKSIEESQMRMSVDVFESFGEKLLDIICHDMIAGHDICKISSLSCINTLLEFDSFTNITNFISNRGYLSHIVDSLLKSDEGLCNVLYDSPENMKVLYVYESMMAMLSRVANSRKGAELLLENKILDVLASMKVFDMHPVIRVNNFSRTNQNDEFVPPVDTRYRQILFPAINLCENIISTLTPESHSTIAQVVNFLLSHCDTIETILRCATPFMELGLLQELSCVTGLIARCINQELFGIADLNSNEEVCVGLYRIRRLMLSVFSRFVISENTFKEMLKSENMFYEPSYQNKSLHIKYFLEIASNLSLYCRNANSNHSADHKATGILFSPRNNGPLPRSEERIGSVNIYQGLNDILNQLKGSVEYYNSEKMLLDNLLRQKSLLPNLSIDTKARATFKELSMQVKEKENNLSNCSFITELCLFILWSQLDFLMNKFPLGASKISSQSIVSNNFTNERVCPTDDISQIKKSLISIFNETFSKQLLNTIEFQECYDKGFAEALLRRVKSLTQFI